MTHSHFSDNDGREPVTAAWVMAVGERQNVGSRTHLDYPVLPAVALLIG